MTPAMSLPTSCGFSNPTGNFSKVLWGSTEQRPQLLANAADTGKRLWLRPGQRYLFGRVKRDGVLQAIDHKGVSRRQCIIEVEKVNPGDGSLLHARSKVTVTDENSRSGTLVDGKLLKGTSQDLKDVQHHLKLGAYPHVLTIKWQPVCLSFFLTSKEKRNSDPLGPKRDLLEPLDIKTVQPFISNQTSHVVASKRNTVPGLQALIAGKYIIDNSYVDALVFAATPDDLDGDENLSPLERDFDTAWPDPLQHLPPKGREPTAKPAEAYIPDTARETVFAGWTFVFLEPGQYETVLPAITTGHGKALLYNLDPGKTTAAEVVTYMRNAAGEKSFGSSDHSTDAGGVIMVKPTLKGEWVQWGDELANEVALKLDQKYIDQADFLDAILGKDAASLRRPVPSESMSEPVAPPPTAGKLTNSCCFTMSNESLASSTSIRAPSSASLPQESQAASHPGGIQGNDDVGTTQPMQNPTPEQEAPPPRRRPRTRAAPVSRFKAFDDEFDMDALAPYEPPEESVESQTLPSQETVATPIAVEEEAPEANGHNGHASKRARSPTEDAMVDGLLPAAAAMKRRKIQIDRENQRRGISEVQRHTDERVQLNTRKVPPKREFDVRAAARKQREAKEEAARRDEEGLEAKLGEISVEEMKHLAVVVEMEMPTRKERAARADGNVSDRWDEKWNGRKNFKKFRRKGEDAGTIRRTTQNVIVPLVEVRRKNFGIGEAYWSSSRDKTNESGQHKGSRTGNLSSQTQTQTQSQPQPLTEESTSSPTMTRLQQEAAEIVGAVDMDRPRHTRLADKTQQSQQTMNSSRGKRPANSAASGAAAKKQRTIRTRAASESESDEELRFKFGSRKK